MSFIHPLPLRRSRPRTARPGFTRLRRDSCRGRRLAELIHLTAEPRVLVVLNALTRRAGTEAELVRYCGLPQDELTVLMRILAKQRLVRRRRVGRSLRWHGTSPHLGAWLLEAYQLMTCSSRS